MYGSPFRADKFFTEYALLSILSLVVYWLNKIIYYQERKALKAISVSFVGALFWISILTTVKFIPILLYSLFPVLGLLIAAPLMMIFITSVEMIKISKENPNFYFGKIILQGFVVLLLFQLIMNLWTTNDWEFIQIFKPQENAIYF